MDGQGTCSNAVEILPKIWTAWIGRTNVTDRRQTDRQTDWRQHIANVNVSSLKTMSLNKRNEISTLVSSIHYKQDWAQYWALWQSAEEPDRGRSEHASNNVLRTMTEIRLEYQNWSTYSPKVTSSRWHKMEWSTASKAADKSRRTRVAVTRPGNLWFSFWCVSLAVRNRLFNVSNFL